MELVNILGVLVRHRLLVGAGACLGALIGLLTLYGVSLSPPGLVSRDQIGSTAVARVLVDAPRSVSVNAESEQAGTLAMRAMLLADLMSADPSRAAIARAAGVPARDLLVTGPAVGPPPAMTPLAGLAGVAAANTSRTSSLRLSSDGQLPIIWIDAVAPDPVRAKRLVDAAATTLAAVAASRGAPRPSGVVVKRLGPTGAAPVVRGPRKAFALVAAVVVFSLWCSALVLASSLRWRVAARATGPRVA
jgi:hypothetical protein